MRRRGLIDWSVAEDLRGREVAMGLSEVGHE